MAPQRSDSISTSRHFTVSFNQYFSRLFAFFVGFEDFSRFNSSFLRCCSRLFLSADHTKACINIAELKVKVFAPRKRREPSLVTFVLLANDFDMLGHQTSCWEQMRTNFVLNSCLKQLGLLLSKSVRQMNRTTNITMLGDGHLFINYPSHVHLLKSKRQTFQTSGRGDLQ